MQIQINTDNHINCSANMIGTVEADLTEALRRFGNQITRLEVHFSDANGPKSTGDDKTCLLEARLAGRQPLVVSHEAASLRQAIDGATSKLERALDNLFGKLSDRKSRAPRAGNESD